MNPIPFGAYPAMITPFTAEGAIDYPAVGALLRWFEQCGCSGVFALCASSEIQFLTLEERVALAAYVMANRGRLVVVASGHISDRVEDQLTELNAIAAQKPDVLCLITGRVNMPYDADGNPIPIIADAPKPPELTDAEFIARLQYIMDNLDDQTIPLGLYERPEATNRRLSEDVVRFCAASGRFVFLKETSCETEKINAKIRAAAGSPFRIYNANSTLLLASMRAGAAGFSGIMGNFHPDLYQWLCDHWETAPQSAELVSDYISALSENTKPYPASAKVHLNEIGISMTGYVRSTKTIPVLEEQQLARLRQMERVVQDLRGRLHTFTA